MPQIAIAAAVMAATAAAKHYAVDKPEADKQATLAAKTQEFSPWTGLKAQPFQHVNIGNDLISGATTGAQMGQSMQNADAQGDLLKAQTSYLNRGGSPYTTAAVSQSNAGNPWGNLGFNKQFSSVGGL